MRDDSTDTDTDTQASDGTYLTPALARWRRATDGPLLVLGIGSVPVLLLEFKVDELPWADRWFISAVNVLVLVAFAVDYVVELWLASDRRLFARREWTSLAIVVSQAIALVPGLGGVGILRAARGGRALRAVVVTLRALAVGSAAAHQGRQVIRQHAVRFGLSLAAMTWITAAAAFTLAEDVGEGHRVHSFFDALWWSTTTITTVGYGEVYPVTALGRLIAGFTMLVGISTFAIVTAKIAEFLVRGDLEDLGPGSGA